MLETRNIFFDVEASNKEELLKMICKKAVEYNISDDEQGLYQDFLNREAEFSTGLQDGFAIPHARSERVKEIAIMYIRTKEGIEWGTLDDQLVHYAFVLLVPAHYEGNVHLQMISKLATCLLEDDFKNQVKSSDNKEELKKYIIKMMEEE